MPQSREALEALPGVGRKTANVVLNTAFGEADHRSRHAHFPRRQPHRARTRRRLSKSSGGWRSSPPSEFKRNAHHWLILHGRYICVARKPKCPQCVIRDLCEYGAKTKDGSA